MRLPATDLSSDPDAQRARKRPVDVRVAFARDDGTLQTREGSVQYAKDDAIATGVAGERWPIARRVFDASYDAVPPTRPGEDGVYRKRPRQVLARCMNRAFDVELPGGRGRLEGHAGDWLVQYEPGDLAVVAAAIFRETYELLER